MPYEVDRRRQTSPVRIGEHEVGLGRRTLLIAEAGVNHDGSIEKAIALVDAAIDGGADVVKFQVFRADELATADAQAAAYQRESHGSSQREMLRKLELDDDEYARIRAYCRQRCIEFLATPFSPADVDRLLRLDVHAIKLASTDLNNLPLLRKAASTGLPLIVSTGAATRDEIERAIERLNGLVASGCLILLHCVSGYPTPLHAANLGAIRTLRDLSGVPTGYSDHTCGTEIAGWAVAAGACVLEKHFTLERDAPGPDHAMSLAPAELAEYVRAARQAEVALGGGRLGMTSIEEDVRRVARKSIVARGHIAAGMLLTAEMLAVKRPSGGIEPERVDELLGRRVTRDIDADTQLTWDMVL